MALVRQTHSSTDRNAPAPFDVATEEPSVDSQPSSSAKTLLGLPVELQKMIVEHLTTNADKRNACLTCKEMQTLVTPLLYKDMEIFADCLDETLLTTLKADHPGLSQVRTLRIRSLDQSKDTHESIMQIRVVCRLLSVIPRHSLTRFELPHTRSLAEIHFTVRIRQAKVCNYQHFSSWSDTYRQGYLDLDLTAPQSDELAHVTCLQIFVGAYDSDHVDRAVSILAHTPALRSLDLELEQSDLHENGECCDTAVQILQTMFSSRNSTGQPAQLKSLRINRMCLMRVGKLLTTVLELKNLEHLQLILCTDIDPFLRNLEPLGLSLSSLCIEAFERVDTVELAVNDFIRSLNPIKRLVLKWQGICFFDERSLRSHASTLEALRVEDDPLEMAILPTFTHAPNLEQLALSGFKIEDEWVPEGATRCYDVLELLSVLESFPSLRVLKLTVHCAYVHDAIAPIQMLYMQPVLQTLKGVAEQMFGSKLPSLTAVVFAIDVLDSGTTFAFLRSRKVGQAGEEKYSAIAVEPHMVKHHVPCADILEAERFVFT